MTVKIQIFTSASEAEALWRAAEAHGVAYGFQSFSWLSMWQETIGTAEGTAPYIVCILDETGAPVMLLPLALIKSFGCQILTFLGGRLADYNAPIIRADYLHRLGVAHFGAIWRDILQALPASVDVICLSSLAEHIEGIANPLTELPGVRRAAVGYFAILETLTQFTKRQPIDLLRDSRRQHRRLAELGAVSFRVAENRVEAAAFLDALMEQRTKQRDRDSGYSGLLQAPAYRAFYEGMALEHCSTGLIHVAALCVDEQIIAAHWGMVHRDRFYSLVPSYEGGRWAKYSPGRLLLEHLVGWCFAERIRVFDLTVGDEAYKLQWTDRTMVLFDLIEPRSCRGRLLVFAWRVVAAMKDRLRRYPRLIALLRRRRRRHAVA